MSVKKQNGTVVWIRSPRYAGVDDVMIFPLVSNAAPSLDVVVARDAAKCPENFCSAAWTNSLNAPNYSW